MATFGNTANDNNDSALDTPDRIRGGNYTPASSGTATSISARLRAKDFEHDETFKCMLYNESTLALVGTTETKAVSLTFVYQWFTWNFVVQPAIVAGTSYIICIWDDNVLANYMAYSGLGTSTDYYTDAYAFNGAPDPIVFNTFTNSNPCIYCTYTEGGGAVVVPHHFFPITRHMNQRTGRRRAWQYR